MRTGILLTDSSIDRQRLGALIRDRNAPQKHVWRAEIILLSSDGVGTVEIMRQTGKSKTCVWRWQGRNMQRHRHQEFIRFLNAIDAEVPASKAIHVVLDNYAAHKHPKVRAWLGRHQRFTFHFTPTSCSWLNAVEGFFAKLSKHRLRRGVFHSVVDLQAAINRFVAEHNQQPKPFTWTADPDKIIAAVKRGHQMLGSIH
ncbi:IS630 family transposase [Mesorhizobium sp. C268A]|uniref:IS630 family transposase n=1 Tax=Mesorhizobium sp. C268A TaxID=2956826 RepID=UPI0033395576